MPVVEKLEPASISSRRLVQIRNLLDRAFAGKFSEEDWEHTTGGWHLLLTVDEEVVAHAAVVERILEVDGRPLRTGYVEGVATDPRRQGEGFGSRVMAAASEVVEEGFEMGALSTGAHRFYERLGWERWQGPTYVRHEGGSIRTKEEDDGLMVLRFGASRGVTLTAAISCESRHGDDW